ncbi:hypothetical protein WJ28_10850 [Burkholderia thailandensis]|nr:hypothetical protein WJ28_10850 [Burkholderia thailandensis]NOK54574.1 hypothetical protein [Burkholderia thailandensis]PNE71579.1 hypothetical protein A8H38_05110 [Burkholderia thailandensis]
MATAGASAIDPAVRHEVVEPSTRIVCRVERRTSNVERRTSNVERRTSNVERRTSNVGMAAPRRR